MIIYQVGAESLHIHFCDYAVASLDYVRSMIQSMMLFAWLDDAVHK